jgi:hypothetical protein
VEYEMEFWLLRKPTQCLGGQNGHSGKGGKNKRPESQPPWLSAAATPASSRWSKLLLHNQDDALWLILFAALSQWGLSSFHQGNPELVQNSCSSNGRRGSKSGYPKTAEGPINETSTTRTAIEL